MKMRVVIYALGKVFERYKSRITWEHVVALADKECKAGQTVYGYPVVSPESLCGLDYDYIAIFSNQLFEEIRRELSGQYFIPQEKLIHWREVLSVVDDMTINQLHFSKKYICDENFKKILMVGKSTIDQIYLTKEEFMSGKDTLLDIVLNEGVHSNINLYDHVYKSIEDCDVHYDVLFLFNVMQYDHKQLNCYRQYAAHILFFTPYLLDGKSAVKIVKEKMERYGKCRYFSHLLGLLWVIDTEDVETLEDIAIYVVTHKKYNVKNDKLYQPLCVGNYWQKGYLSERTGENISYLNAKINECTALYWIWKNTNEKFIGLNHYRRYFYNNDMKSLENYLDLEHISEFMKNYDIILPTTYPMTTQTEYGQIYDGIDHNLCKTGYLLLRNKIAKHQPDYLEAFDDVMGGNNAFLCNMFITRREILNQYCEWLFSFLIEAADKIDVNGYDNYSQRVMGFFAERMWTVWLRRNKLRIKELPYVIT